MTGLFGQLPNCSQSFLYPVLRELLILLSANSGDILISPRFERMALLSFDTCPSERQVYAVNLKLFPSEKPFESVSVYFSADSLSAIDACEPRACGGCPTSPEPFARSGPFRRRTTEQIGKSSPSCTPTGKPRQGCSLTMEVLCSQTA